MSVLHHLDTSLTSNASQVNRRQSLALLAAFCAGSVAAQEELDDLAKIRSKGMLKVAVYKDNAPFSSGHNSDMTGLDIALAQALAQKLQLKPTLLPFDAGENMNDDLRNMVWRGHYLGYGPADVMLHVPVDKYLSQQNRQVVIFAPYMRQIPVLLRDVKAMPQFSEPQDLKPFKLAAERGTGTAGALIGQNSGALSGQVVLFNSGMEAARAVFHGQVQAAYILQSQAEAAMAQNKRDPANYPITPMSLPGLPDNGWPIGMAVKTSFKDLGQALQAAMKELRESGELLAMFKERGMTLTAP
ncbi:MAG: extracellular solute-binding protein [Comamonadaceae bacterium]|nr:MAG: extracellular solute-binding protein [Comamonadaceae bacterium]